ncbi:MAG: S8 family serine peptidase [Burkholderiaceae bacterium]|nr:S8 family serine peptidase [Burkholderiaceae bacterium]
MKLSLLQAALAATIFSALPALAIAAPASADLGYARGRILVQPNAGLSGAEFDAILKVHGGKGRKLGQSDLHLVELPGNASETAVIERLKHNPGIKFAELDRRVPHTLAVNDPYAGSEWHLAKVGANTAWDSTMGAGVTIAILDSGVDGAHPDLLPNMVPGFNTYDNNTNTADVCGHGTAVAGTAAAAANNGVGVAGIAGKAAIMPIRIAYFDTTANACYGYISTIANGLTWAADHGARVANVSYGGVAGSATIQSAAQYMKNKGGLVFVSAGNNGVNENVTPTSTMVVVSATDQNDAKTSWSSYGSFVTLAAPGLSIYATTKGGTYQAWSGTSFSSPLSAGVAALMMSAQPSLDGAAIEQLMYSTAVDLGTAGRDQTFGYGRVNAAAAVKAALAAVGTPDTQAPASAIGAPLAGATVGGLVAVNVGASDNVGVTRVELKVNGSVVAVDDTAPYAFSWNSAGVANGMNNLVAVAYDAAGNVGSSAAVAVNVANSTTPVTTDTTAPVVRINNPVAGAVAGNVSISVSATDNSGAAGIRQTLYIDGVVKASATGGSLAYSWNTRKVAAGSHTIQVVARDAANNASSTSVLVTR